MKRHWVLGFCFNESRAHVLLIVKTHPPYLAKKFNGIGGNIHEGETPHQAMEREFLEETGLSGAWWRQFGTMETPRGVMELFAGVHPNITAFRQTTEEIVAVSPLVQVMFPKHEEDWMPNLRWLVSMAQARIIGRDNCTHFFIKES